MRRPHSQISQLQNCEPTQAFTKAGFDMLSELSMHIRRKPPRMAGDSVGGTASAAAILDCFPPWVAKISPRACTFWHPLPPLQ